MAKVAIMFRDATGTHTVGSEVTFPDEIVARLISVGILEPLPEGESETPVLPESAPEPVEEVKEKPSPKRRRSTRPKGS